MSKVLVLRLAGPMQSWGSASRFTRRSTEAFPTKSGIVGLLAAAQGRRRTDPIEDLVALKMAARIDQPGKLLRDFHTAHRGAVSMPLSERFYLSDAIFVAFLEGSDEVIDGLADSIQCPAFPLYLGRRSCPPVMPLFMEVHQGPTREVIESLPWQAARFHQRQRQHESEISLRVIADKGMVDVPGDVTHSLQDVPVSFDSRRRLYRQRHIDETRVTIPNPAFQASTAPPNVSLVGYDPMEVL